MPAPKEIGTLRALPNGESLFVGSSSGVFFINTVRRAFTHAAATATHGHTTNDSRVERSPATLPPLEDCIVGPESHVDENWSSVTGASPDDDTARSRASGGKSWFLDNTEDIGKLPDQNVSKELLMTFFRTWHPLFPFLHGPSCVDSLEKVFTSGQVTSSHSLSTAIMFQCIFNIAKLDRPDLPPLGQSQIRSEEQLILALSIVSLKCDLASIQALLAAQLYFVAIMDLRAASSTGGLVIRSIFKSGLHRCPVRYSHLMASDGDMRKRVFWSAYTLDRYVSQSLGHPLGIQDLDYDVCSPGEIDLHQPVRPANGLGEGPSPKDSISHLPANHPGRRYASSQSTPDGCLQNESRENSAPSGEGEQRAEPQPSTTVETEPGSQRRRENQSIQAQFVKYSRLIGRLVEMFHKSIHARSASRQSILFLKADVDAWGNDIPLSFMTPSTSGDDAENAMRRESHSTTLHRDVFFRVAHQQLLLLVNRPSLSLEPTSGEFCHAIQICIGAARSTIRILKSYTDSGGALFWPGFMSAVWMSGLVMAFACQLKLQGISNALIDISAALEILDVMGQRWHMAQNCHSVLSMLLQNIQDPEAQQASNDAYTPGRTPIRGEKRQRDDESMHRTSLEHHDVDNNQYQRTRPRLTPQSSRPVATASPGQRAQSANTHGFHISQRPEPRPSLYADPFQQSAQTAAPVPAPLDSLSLYPHFVENRNGSQFLPSTYGYTPNMQAMNTSEFATLQNSEGAGWDTAPGIPCLGPTTFYDVFDGATWGSLMDLADQGI